MMPSSCGNASSTPALAKAPDASVLIAYRIRRAISLQPPAQQQAAPGVTEQTDLKPGQQAWNGASPSFPCRSR